MKYNTISTSSLASEGRKSTLTIYADMDISHNKEENTESEIASIRGELEIVQKALKLQTKRCRQLVAEYTRKLQEKEQQYYSEKSLREDQLAKVLRALLIFESRLKQEQKLISHQLNEKDYIIKKQSNDIKKLLTNQYCKNCNQFYSNSPMLESFDSSSEYVTTDFQDYQSSNFESLDSSSETYATISEKGYDKSDSPYLNEEKLDSESSKSLYKKNRNVDSLGRRSKKHQHRKSIGTYFEVLKLRGQTVSPGSNEDNTSNDYDNLDSLPPESITDKISLVSESIENIFNKSKENLNETESSPNISLSECNNTVIDNNAKNSENNNKEENINIDNDEPNTYFKDSSRSEDVNTEVPEVKVSKISDSIPLFETDGETNDNWYASASDPEDEEHRNVYRNNPVLECMNQILLQNISDNLNSPPKTPNIERKSGKNKRVKFSDEEDNKQPEKSLTQENLQDTQDYYETPIQKTPNFYEAPQSIYSNDYEQILSKCSETFSDSNPNDIDSKSKTVSSKMVASPDNNHYYVDMETKPGHEESKADNNKIVRKSKILRTPPALPPKPANLVSKYKIQQLSKFSDTNTDTSSEPDYCSISELNVPQTKTISGRKINVVAEINAPTSNDVRNKLEKADTVKLKNVDVADYDPVIVNNAVPNLVVKKCIEKFNIQMAKQTPIKSETSTVTINLKSPKKVEPEIPKLPQVSEIIIPSDTEENKEQVERISQDNYVKNNSQIFKLKTHTEPRRSIVIGSSVSSLITGFNNQQLINEIKKKPERNKLDKKLFSSFENLQDLDKHITSPNKGTNPETPNFENFDLSQNFEEFKLDDCEIEEYNVDISDKEDEIKIIDNINGKKEPVLIPKGNSGTRVELIRATNDVTVPNLNRNSIELLKKQIEVQKHEVSKEEKTRIINEPTYEHFLECTGLSTKSILTPSRLLSNHKSMLKPKDVKLRSKVKANNLIERHSSGAVKYWSEPFI